MMAKHERAKVFVLDDDPEVRESLAWLLEGAGFDVVPFDSPHAFLDACAQGARGCLLLDLRMPDMSGLELQEVLAARGMELPVIVLTAHADVPTTVQVMRAGAFDVLQKPFDEAVLLDRIDRALRAGATARRREDEHAEIAALLDTLTPREREVLDWLVQGAATKQIARHLDISIRTAEVHRSNVMHKMEAGSLADLVARVVRYRDGHGGSGDAT
jgi:two-component system response regulator FixJ